MKRAILQRGLLVFVSAALLLPVDRAGAYSWFQYGGINVIWPTFQADYYLSPSTFPNGSDPQTHFLAALGLWNLVPACDFEYFYGLLAQDYVFDSFDGINYTAAVPASSLDPGTLGVTFLVNDGPDWYDMDLAFSDLPEGVGWTFDPNPGYDVITAPTPSNGFSFLLVAVHELGHGLGLGHDPIGNEPPGSPWIIATMNPRYPTGGPVGQQNIIELHTDDRNGARFLYPHSGPSGPAVVDLAGANYTFGPEVGKAIPVFFTPAAVDPGDELTVRSVIENFGTTNEFFVRQGFYLSADSLIETSDMLIASADWDLAFQDAIDFDIILDMPADLATGSYYVGSIFDDLDEVAEDFEDNNAVVYHQTLTVNQLIPAITELGQSNGTCGQPFTGPTPSVTHPLNMAALTWSLDNPEPGMTINPATGVISWPDPVQSPFLYTLIVRATNGAGSSTRILFLGIEGAIPEIVPIPDDQANCVAVYTSPLPQLTDPACMTPINNYSLDAGPIGMTINANTGVVSWPNPVPSATPYDITVRATNDTGGGTESWSLTVFGGGDMNMDHGVDLVDFLSLAGCFAATGGPLMPDCDCADLDKDNDVDLNDFLIFASHFAG